MTHIAPFNSRHLEAACRVLADTERGLTGTQIERLLQEIKITDTSPGMTKWKRLFNSMVHLRPIHDEAGYDQMVALMNARGLNQDDLGAIVPQSNLSAILAGKRKISATLAGKLGKFFGVSPALFVPI